MTEKNMKIGRASVGKSVEDEKMAVYQELGSERCLRMILKANEKNPDGATLGEEHWSGLPTTLRYAIANKIMGVEGAVKENFTI